jgi:protein-disulfide isomerase
MRFLFTLFLTAAVCGIVGAQTSAPAQKPALDKAALANYIRQVELLPPQLSVKVGDPKASIYPNFLDVPVEVETPNGIYALHYFVSKDGQLLIKGNIFDVNKPPFENERKQLKTDQQPSFGTPGAPIVIVVFSDFQCPNCREEAKVLREHLQKDYAKDVHVYFKDFPLDKLHPWARQAAIAGRCIFHEQPASFWDFHDWIYEHQAEITADNLKTKVLGWAETKNLNAAKLGECMDSKATEKEVDREVAEGRALGVSGTPTIFINGRPMTGAIPWQTLDQILKAELEYAKKNGAGEKCCEIAIPGLAK